MGFEVLTEKLFRLKTVGADFLETQLKRCLSTFDITLLGVGHMIGAGVYVLTGAVVRNTAGPGIVLSFIFAGIASLLSALCYAEFGARVPKAGSAYTYAYVTVGEFWAFVIGWNIILEHMLGAAAVARSWSGYLDSLLGHVIKNGTMAAVGEMETAGHIFGDYPDFIAFLVVIIVAAFMGYGAKSSTNLNAVFTVINLTVILFVTIFGFTFADVSLWSSSSPHGGFMPFGFGGVLAGAASCFFAYIGFDGIATAGEEASDPGRSIPIATFVCMSIVTCAYVLMSSALTLMIPYDQVHPTSAFADAFEQRGAVWAKYVVAVGALSGMTTSLVGSLFALPRCVYAMANDGLIFRPLAHIHSKTQVPTLAVAVFGAATSLIALLFDVETLVEFLSIGTLMAYTIVSSSVIILRYQPNAVNSNARTETSSRTTAEDRRRRSSGGGFSEFPPEEEHDEARLVRSDSFAGQLKPRFALLRPVTDRFEAGKLVGWAVSGMVVFFICLSAVITYGDATTWWCVFFILIFTVAALSCLALIYVHHQSSEQIRFKVPIVPFLPSLSIFVNIILMMHLSPLTWLRLAIWLCVGFLVYFLYGIKHSQENVKMAATTSYNALDNTPTATFAADSTRTGHADASVTIEKTGTAQP